MKSLFETIKSHSEGKGEDVMWRSVRLVSEAVEKIFPDTEKDSLMAEVYGLMSDGHYNEEYDVKCVERMYHAGKDGVKHQAPYWTFQQVKEIFDRYKDKISAYNAWDWYVAFHIVASANWELLHSWWPDITPELFAQKVGELALAWLADPNTPGTSKVWDYKHMGARY